MTIIDIQPGDRQFPGPGIYRLADNSAANFICLIRLADLIRDCLPDVPVNDYRTLPGKELGPNTGRIGFLSHEEINHVNGFRSLKKQVEWTGGRFALKTLAAQVLPDAGLPQQIRVGYESRGAPYLVGKSEISISISHAGDYAAAGMCLTVGKRIGLDIERMARDGLDDVKRVAFTEREVAAAGDSLERAFRIWTAKEAYLKFIKTGFRENLKRVDVSGCPLVHNGMPMAGVVVESLQFGQAYCLAIVHS